MSAAPGTLCSVCFCCAPHGVSALWDLGAPEENPALSPCQIRGFSTGQLVKFILKAARYMVILASQLQATCQVGGQQCPPLQRCLTAAGAEVVPRVAWASNLEGLEERMPESSPC